MHLRREPAPRRVLTGLSSLCILGLVLAACGQPHTPNAAPSSPSGGPIAGLAQRLEPRTEEPEGLSADDWAAIHGQIERDRYRVERRRDGEGESGRVGAEVDSVYRAANPAQRLRLGFGAGGITAGPLDDGASWSWGLRPASWGYGAEQQAVLPVEPIADGNRVEYRRGALVEWYVNERRGLEQGFTLLERPGVDPAHGVLRLELVAHGNLEPTLTDEGLAVVWQDQAGQAVLRYAGLVAWDAGGRTVAAALRLAGDRVWLEVDDREAAYPLTIDPWVQQARLEQAGAPLDLYGSSVALSGNTALVGAQFAAVGANGAQGAAYVFVRSGTTWAFQQKLTAADGTVGARFGWSVALSGNTALIGAYQADVGMKAGQGAAYVFVRSGTNWSQQGSRLIAADGAAGDAFGSGVALSGETALVGAPLANVGAEANQGAAYVFVRSGTTWSFQRKLTQAVGNGSADDFFGQSVALGGETALVGAPGVDIGRRSAQGAAYAFVRSGTIWTEQQILLANDGGAGDQLGQSVALSGGTALVGAYRADVGGSGLGGGNRAQGAAYVFVRSGTSWSQEQKLIASDGAADDQLGWSVALDGETALVGAIEAAVAGKADQGAAYAFVRSGTTWAQQQKLTADDGAAGDGFGSSVALSGTTALVGVPLADIGEKENHGAAYVFEFSPDPTPTPTVTPTATATADPTATPTATATATPTFVPCKAPKPKLKAKLRKGTRTADLTIDPKSFAPPCAFMRAAVDWGDGSPPEILTTPAAVHTYDGPGSFRLGLTVIDNGGHTVTAKPKTLKVK